MKLRSAFLPSGEEAGSALRTVWDRLKDLPLGKRLFSQAIGRLAPYTGSIGAKVEEMSPRYARVVLEDRRAVRNHLHCVHAIALANLAELTGNMAIAYTMPNDARFIVAGLSIEYGKKARGNITATAECPAIESNARAEYPVTVTMRDPQNDLVASCVLRTLVGPLR